MGDVLAMVLMVFVTLIALAIIWGTYVKRHALGRRR
jgi:cell division protein FtsL